MSAIEFRDVTLRLGSRNVLAEVSLEIATGELIGVLGPNGAGKTTLMRAVLGLVPAQTGTVRVFGWPARRGNPLIGYLPQTRSTGGHVRLSGREFVAAIANGHRLGVPFSGRAARAEIDRVLDLVDAAELAKRPLAHLSGGERQRLLLAQALIGRPQLLLLDEPLANLDLHYLDEVLALTKRLQEELRITILLSAHELNALLGIIDSVLYLGAGKAALGAVDEIVTAPVLSRLYGTEIEVIRARGRIFVMAGGHDVERDPHQHDDAPAARDPLLGVSSRNA